MTRIFRRVVRLGLISVVVGSAIACWGNRAIAQITPDNSLGGENSVVNDTGNGIDTITGGATRDTNLFHSFDSFSVPNGRAALFDNGANIQNIITRVTGSSISDIDGAIAARGTANLFLLNPNGIVFGQNARLFIGGSFIATTARSIDFADGTQFSATPGAGAPLLTVSVPRGLQFGTGTGNIINRSQAVDRNNQIVGLQVQSGKTLGLIGGNVSLEGGILTAVGGRIELGAVASPGVVTLNAENNNIRFSFPSDLTLSNISLTNAASARTVASNGGSIAVNTGNLKISDGSSLVAGLIGGTVDSQAGDIEVNARDSVIIEGTGSSTRSSTITNGVLDFGNAGNIAIATGSLDLIGNAQIGSINNGLGNTGNVDIQARWVTIAGNGTEFSGLLSVIGPSGVGNGADIRIQADTLSMSQGSLATSTLGRGNAGNIVLNVKNGITISGRSLLQAASFSQGNAGDVIITSGDRVSFDSGLALTNLAFPSDIPNQDNNTLGEIPQPQGDRQGGDIRISAPLVSLSNLSLLETSTRGQGNAGNIQINASDSVSIGSNSILRAASFSSSRGGDISIAARSLFLTDGGQAVSSTSGEGNAGNVRVDVTDDVILSGGGVLQAASIGRGNAGNITINAGDRVSLDGLGGVLSIVLEFGQLRGEGQGGDINIQARSLSLTNNSQLNSSNLVQGRAGNIDVNVRSLDLVDGGSIFAATNSGDGGNIRLRVSKEIRLRNNSQISTTAGIFQLAGNGGNISIESPLIIANAEGNNDITANAFNGKGGRVDITADSVFGLTPRSRQELQTLLGTNDPIQLDPNRLASNDITAISQTNPSLSGTVSFNAADIDPSRDIVELPTGLVDASTRVAAGCPSGAENRFTVAGRGGLPPAPADKLSPDALLTDWASLPTSATGKGATVDKAMPTATHTIPTPIVEASSWQFDLDGKVLLTAAPQASDRRHDAPATSCHGS